MFLLLMKPGVFFLWVSLMAFASATWTRFLFTLENLKWLENTKKINLNYGSLTPRHGPLNCIINWYGHVRYMTHSNSFFISCRSTSCWCPLSIFALTFSFDIVRESLIAFPSSLWSCWTLSTSGKHSGKRMLCQNKIKSNLHLIVPADVP